MSHFSTFKVSGVAGITLAMLMAAIGKLAELEGLKTTTTIRDYYGKTQTVQAGLVGAGIENGIGFSLDAQGHIQVHGDSYNSTRYNNIQNLLTKHATAQKIANNIRTQYRNANITIRPVNKDVQVEAIY